MKSIALQFGLCAAILLAAGSAHGAVYADFETPHGTFTVELDVLNAPRATANFLGLADGSQTWRDPVTGAVRGGEAGDSSFYDGMRFYATAGQAALLGGLRSYTGTTGTEYWEGPGYTILDEVTNGVDLARGVLAMPEFEGPHSGGGELAVMLTNDAYLGSGWTAFGMVTGAGMAVVDAIVSEVTNADTRVAAQITIRDAGITSQETQALAIARNDLPMMEEMPLGLTREGDGTRTVSFWSLPQSQACLAVSSNLMKDGWSVMPGNWNSDTNQAWMSVPLAYVPGLVDGLGFLYGSQAVYPKMTASLFSDKCRIAVAHTGVDYQYWLDFAGGTGIWARVEDGAPVESGSISSLGQELARANSVHLVLVIGLNAYHYWFGFDEAGTSDGRFYCEIRYLNSPPPTATDSGTFIYEDGWGAKVPAMKNRRRSSRTKTAARAPADRKSTLLLNNEWPAPRRLRR